MIRGWLSALAHTSNTIHADLFIAADTARELGKEIEWERSCDGFISSCVWVKVVSRVVRWVQLGVIRRVSDDSIEINDGVKLAAITDPSIDSQASLLPLWIRVRLDCAVWSTKGRNGGSEDWDSKCVHTSDDLLVRLDDAITDDLLRRWRWRLNTDIIDSLEDHGIADTGLCEDIPINSADCVWSVAIGKDAVSSCCLVHDCDIGSCRIGLHTAENQVRPAGIAICNASATVGNAVANDTKGSRRWRRPRLHCRDKKPVSRALLGRVGDGEISGSHLVAE